MAVDPPRELEGPGASAGKLPRLGERVGEYVLEELLGRGGMGAVFSGRHVELGVRHAIKVQKLTGEDTRKSRAERFAREAKALAKLDHPGVVRIHAYGMLPDHEDMGYIIMDLIEGDDLRREVVQGPLPIERALEVGRAIALSLAHMHERGVVHRDLKPANVMIRSDDGRPVLADLGLSLDQEETERLTRTGQIVGTLAYMAPEQLTGKKEGIGPKTDVFAWGALLYELLTSQEAFTGAHPALVARAIAEQPSPAPRAVRKEVPSGLDLLVVRSLAKAPADRPSARELAEALESLQSGDALPARWRPSWRRRLIRAAGALGLVVVVLTALLAIRSAPPPATEALEEHLAWEARVLDPLDLGVRSRDALRVERTELVRREGILAGLSDRLEGREREQADRARGLVRAYLRLLDHRAGVQVPVPPDPERRRPAAELVVDAVVLDERGETEEALARVKRVGSSFRPARLLALRLLAESAPVRFLAQARAVEEGGTAAARDLARELTPSACARRYRELVLSATERPRSETRFHLEQLISAARLLKVEPTSLAAAKWKALDAAAPKWEAKLGDAIARERENLVVSELAFLVGFEPKVRLGPAMRKVLDRTLDRLTTLHERAVRDGKPRRIPTLRRRVFRYERRLFYELDPTPRETPALRKMLDDAGSLGIPEPVVVLACMRYGTIRSMTRLERLVPGDKLDALLRPYPTSRLRRARRLMARLVRRTTGPGPMPELRTALDALRGIYRGGLDDLAPRSRCRLKAEVSYHVDRRVRGLRREHKRELAKGLQELGIACRQQLVVTFPFPTQEEALVRCLKVRLQAARVLAGWEGAAAVLRQEIIFQRARVKAVEANVVRSDARAERSALAKLLYMQCERMQPSDMAVRIGREALRLWSGMQNPRIPIVLNDVRVVVAKHLRKLRRYDEAWALLSPQEGEWIAVSVRFAKELATLALKRGQRQEAIRLLREAHRRNRYERKRIEQVRRELGLPK